MPRSGRARRALRPEPVRASHCVLAAHAGLSLTVGVVAPEAAGAAGLAAAGALGVLATGAGVVVVPPARTGASGAEPLGSGSARGQSAAHATPLIRVTRFAPPSTNQRLPEASIIG